MSKSANKLDYLTAWFIAQFLTTLNLVPPSQTDDDVMFRVCNSLIAYIDIVGNNFKWCIYIALHLPGDDQFIRLRQKLVQQLLQQHVEEWINDSSALQELGVPRSWLEEAKGYFYQYNHEEEKQLSALLGCGKMREAHDLLFNKIGPQLFLRKQFLQLSQLCSVFQNESISRRVELFQKYIYYNSNFKQVILSRWIQGLPKNCSKIFNSCKEKLDKQETAVPVYVLSFKK
eukprot:TRINITY_DN1728_c0_g2_i1.p1 TRINITY_DN1728_c0_g2~~TRINITY_DN1728_c0_g2_i1.p1  ORF type:complete len:230 (+),score=13.72 TRINITY_DN1728_c0_g2_i1:17-706(+)